MLLRVTLVTLKLPRLVPVLPLKFTQAFEAFVAVVAKVARVARVARVALVAALALVADEAKVALSACLFRDFLVCLLGELGEASANNGLKNQSNKYRRIAIRDLMFNFHGYEF